jgi:hypothetical protein
MLPDRPVDGLEYSPTHFPANEARSLESPLTEIGVGFDAQAIAAAVPATASQS